MSNDQLSRMLAAKVGFETVNVSVQNGSIRFIGRVSNNKVLSTKWMSYVTTLLQNDAGVDVSRKYFLHGNRLVYAWRLVVEAKPTPEAAMQRMLNELESMPMGTDMQPIMVNSVPHDGPNGKGVGFVDKRAVGVELYMLKERGNMMGG